MSEQHDKFLQRLDASSEAVFAIAKWLHRHGLRVDIPGMRKAATAAEAAGFLDDGDLFILRESGPRRVEVKRIGKDFTGADTWPFGNEVFVSNAAAAERAHGKVEVYFYLNPAMTHAAVVVPDETVDRWYTKTIRAGNTGNFEEVCVCPKDVVRFVELA